VKVANNLSARLHRLFASASIRLGWLVSSFVYQAVIVAKLTYAASAWWGFANASDRSRLESVLRRRKQSGLCFADVPIVVDRADDKLFESIVNTA